MVVPPIVNEIRTLPAELHPFYMYLRQAMGPFAQGPVALIARHDDECVFSADALGLRPLWKLETPDDYIFSSEPGVVCVEDMVSEPLPLGPGEKFMVTIDAERRRARPCTPTTRCCARSPRRWLERTGADARRALRPRAGDGRAARGRRTSRATRRPGPAEPVEVVRPRSWPASAGSATTSSSSSRWPPTAPSRSARWATTARWRRSRPSVRTSPTTSRRRWPWSPTRRSTASARWSTSRPARCSGAGPRSTTPAADTGTVETSFPVILGGHHDLAPLSDATYRKIARDHSTYLLEDLWEEFRGRAAAIDIALLESETTAGRDRRASSRRP